MKLLTLESLCLCSESFDQASLYAACLSHASWSYINYVKYDDTVGVHVHNIQINFWKPDRVSVTEGQLPAGGP